jgi:hypothetical protein
LRQGFTMEPGWPQTHNPPASATWVLEFRHSQSLIDFLSFLFSFFLSFFSFFLLSPFFGGTRVWTQGFTLIEQAF